MLKGKVFIFKIQFLLILQSDNMLTRGSSEIYESKTSVLVQSNILLENVFWAKKPKACFSCLYIYLRNIYFWVN